MKNINAILITGSPGVGKTTIIKRISTELKCDFAGFYTEEVRNEGKERIGFDIVGFDNQRGSLARIGVASKTSPNHRIGKYAVHVQEFEEIALPIFSSNKALLLIDEIGKMELLSYKFSEQIEVLISKIEEKSINVIATIPSNTRTPIRVVDMLKSLSSSITIEVTKSNRNTIYNGAISKCLQDMLEV